MQLRKISFKTKLIIFIEILIILTNSFLGFFIWRQLSFMAREISRAKLMSIASTTAGLIDAERHEKIQAEDDDDSSAYEKIQAFLQKVMKANPEANGIYTARKIADERWVYVVGGYATHDANEDGIISKSEKGVGIGEELDVSLFPEIKKSFDGPAADKELNCDKDKQSCQLSGYAPIRDKYGQTVAIVIVNINAKNIVDFEKNTCRIILSVLGFIFILFPLIIYLFLTYLNRPVNK